MSVGGKDDLSLVAFCPKSVSARVASLFHSIDRDSSSTGVDTCDTVYAPLLLSLAHDISGSWKFRELFMNADRGLVSREQSRRFAFGFSVRGVKSEHCEQHPVVQEFSIERENCTYLSRNEGDVSVFPGFGEPLPQRSVLLMDAKSCHPVASMRLRMRLEREGHWLVCEQLDLLGGCFVAVDIRRTILCAVEPNPSLVLHQSYSDLGDTLRGELEVVAVQSAEYLLCGLRHRMCRER